jgi:hypothetical protein
VKWQIQVMIFTRIKLKTVEELMMGLVIALVNREAKIKVQGKRGRKKHSESKICV